MRVTWRTTPTGLRPFDDKGKEIVWAPQPGWQEHALSCPLREVLLEGNRGGGKSEVLLMDFAQHVGAGFGPYWRGIIFRHTFPQLADLITKTFAIFPRAFPGVKYNATDHKWVFKDGETLKLSYMETERDYWNHHGHEYSFIGWEELTTWADDRCYRRMFSCLRCPRPDVPKKIRANTNPSGPGTNWVKTRFGLPVPVGAGHGPKIMDNGEERVALHCPLSQNKVLMAADPGYIHRIAASASSPGQKIAWTAEDGSGWNVIDGGMVDDVWRPAIHVLLDLDPRQIPAGWRMDRAYDHGQSKPGSVGWYAESNGEPMVLPDGRKIGVKKGDLIRFREWYIWSGQPNEGLRLRAADIAKGIKEREKLWGIWGRVKAGPADASIFDDFEPGKSVAGYMAKEGIRWEAADKRPGSRKQGWQSIRQMLEGAIPGPEGVREQAGLFVCRCCQQFLRTVPVLPRDTKDPDDVDTNSEDHVGDELRYRVRARNRRAGMVDW